MPTVNGGNHPIIFSRHAVILRPVKKTPYFKMLKSCKKGHRYFKTSDCPTCPVCEAERKPKVGFLSKLAAPARRALEQNGILTVEDLSKYSKDELLKLHGIGKSSLPVLLEALKEKGMKFRGD